MKAIKILFVFAALLFAGSMAAQDVTVRSGGTHFNVALDAGDTISNNSTTLSKTIGVGAKEVVQLYSIQVTVDSISGTPTEAWVLAGSMDNVNWTTITTVNWTGTSSDTTFHYTDISTGVAWPFLRVKGTESGTAKAQLTKLKGRFLDEVR
jgi:hypothetical protein